MRTGKQFASMNIKINNNIRRASLLLAAGAAFLPGMAQQLHESISVDGKYVPDVIRIDRINTFPKALGATLETRPLDYETGGVTAAFSPFMLAMPATGWQASRQFSNRPGYLEFGVGSWLNSTLSAGYRFVDNSSTLFGVRLQHNSTSLWKPERSEVTADEKQYRYDESVGLYGSHLFKGVGRLDAAIDYHVGSFNYYGVTSLPVPGQTINDFSLRADWRSLIAPSSSVDWHAGARMRHFAYRQDILPGAERVVATGGRETDVNLNAGVRMPWESGSSIGLDGNLDMLFLNSKSVDDYAMLTLTPWYRFTKGLLDIRVGADIDLSFKAGPDGNRYSFFHIAPDIRMALQTGQVGLYLNLEGGSKLNTLSYLHELDYYAMPGFLSTRPSYTPLDAAFGINLGPFAGFSMGVEARYRATRNLPLGGWYMAYLNNGIKPVDGLSPEPGRGDIPQYCTDADGVNLHGASFSARLSYAYGRTFSITADGSYQPQDGKKGFFNGYDRARITASVKATVRPVEPLSIGVGYDYRGVRNIYTTFAGTLLGDDPFATTPDATLTRLRLPDLTLLNLSAGWDFTPDLSVWLQADNLLNRHDEVLPMQPTQGVVIVAGLRWQF